MPWPEWFKLNARAIEVAALCISIPSAVISVHQAWSASDEAAKADKARIDAEKQVIAAEKQATAAEKQAIIAGAQAKYMEAIAAAQGEHLRVAKAERDEVVRIANANEISNEVNRKKILADSRNLQDQIKADEDRQWEARRARISVDEIDIDLTVGKSPQAVLKLQNPAPTSAINVNVWNSWVRRSADGKLPDTPSCANLPSGSTRVLSGNKNYTLTRDAIWTAEENQTLSSSNPITVIGSICYQDEKHQLHQTTFCRYLDGKFGQGAVSICPLGERER